MDINIHITEKVYTCHIISQYQIFQKPWATVANFQNKSLLLAYSHAAAPAEGIFKACL